MHISEMSKFSDNSSKSLFLIIFYGFRFIYFDHGQSILAYTTMQDQLFCVKIFINYLVC